MQKTLKKYFPVFLLPTVIAFCIKVILKSGCALLYNIMWDSKMQKHLLSFLTLPIREI